jgi:hypothetical protein
MIRYATPGTKVVTMPNIVDASIIDRERFVDVMNSPRYAKSIAPALAMLKIIN